MDVSADIGFAYSQFLANSKEVIFQSAGGEVIRSGFDLLGKQDRLDIRTKEGQWTFERNAMGSRRQDSNWVFSPMYLSAVLLGISETISRQTSMIDINLITGLPYKDWKSIDFKKNCKKRLIGLHEIYRDDKKQVINIENVLIVPQNLGAIFFHFLDSKGAFKNIGKTFTVGSINIGGHTVEMATVEFALNEDGSFSFNIIDSQCRSEPLGMYSVLNGLQELLNEDKKFSGEVWRDHELFDILKSNYLSLYGEKHNVSHLTRPIKDSYQSNKIVGLITTNWSEQSEIQISRLDGLVNSGGGALAMDHDKLREHHPNLLISQRPQWDTVIGYGKLAKLLQRNK